MNVQEIDRRDLLISIALASGALTILVTLGTVVYHFLENWSWSDSFYFSVTTLTTVGFGDLTPSSEASRLFTAFYIIAGVAVSLAALGVVGRNYLELIERRILNERSRSTDRNPSRNEPEAKKKG